MAYPPIVYEIETEVPASYFEKLFDYTYSQFLVQQKQRFTNLSRETTKTDVKLSYDVLEAPGKIIAKVEVTGSDKVTVTIAPFESSLSESAISEMRQDIVIAVQMFEEKARQITWYFAWREGEEIVPEKVELQEKSLNRLFLETQILLTLVFMILGLGLFAFVETFFPLYFWLVPIVLIGTQFVFVFYSNKIIARSGDWTITKDNPLIHFLEYRPPIDSFKTIDDFKQISREQIALLKKEMYQKIITVHGEINCQEAEKIFNKFGVSCKLGSLRAKRVNVYELVKKVSDRFGYKVPKIIVSNTIAPNAAASGPSPGRGIVLITTGLLVQLEEPGILSVLGHEFGHLKGRDPLILFGLLSAEFLFRFYVLLNLFPFILVSLQFFIYFFAVMTLIFFIAKFFEARADLISAIMMGQPKIMASSLEKIGFHRLLFERVPSFRIQEWIGLDSHPPIYWRVNRLLALREPVIVKHPLIQSIREVVRGFIGSL